MAANRILYGFLLVLSVIFANFYGGKMPYMLLFLVLLLPVISMLYTVVLYFLFRYVQLVDRKYVTKGEKINYRFEISNESILCYPFIKVNFYGNEDFLARQFSSESFFLLPRKKLSFSYEITCSYRGEYMIGMKSVEFEDFMGLFRLVYNIPEPKDIIVLPRIIYLDRFLMKTNLPSDTQSVLNTQYEDLTTISDIRKYSYGDSLKRIHWKLSSKMDELYVKTYHGTSQTAAMFFLDFKQIEVPREVRIKLEDNLIEAVVAVIRYCLFNFIPVNMVYYMNDIVQMEAKTPSDFETIYKTLAQTRFNQNVAVEDIMELFLIDSSKKRDVFIFTANLNYNLYNQLCKVRVNGYEVSVIYVSSTSLTGKSTPEVENILSSLPDVGITVYRINADDDIKMVLES